MEKEKLNSKITEALKALNETNDDFEPRVEAELEAPEKDELNLEDGEIEAKEDEEIQLVVDPEAEDGEDLEEKSYLGKKVIQCHFCGGAFFTDETFEEVEECSICGTTPEDLELVGIVKPIDEEGEDLEDEETETDTEVDIEVEADADIEDEYEDLEFEESKMNKIVNKFLRENYKDVLFYRTKKVVSKSDNRLKIEGIVKYRNGNKSNISFLTDPLSLKESKGKVRFRALSEQFSKSKSFVFEGTIKEGKLSLNGLLYNFKTLYKNESYKVHGRVRLG